MKKLGSGAMGTAYLAESCVIKKYRKKYVRGGINYQILREIAFLRILRSPHIVSLQNIYVGRNNISISLENGGQSLTNFLDRGEGWRAAHCGTIIGDICEALAYMHNMKILHRDIKPDNILISEQDNMFRAKLCDFGLACYFGQEGKEYLTGEMCTALYRPPELFSLYNCKYGPEVDIWSLGCVIMEYITGETPFEGKSETEVLRNIISKIPSAPLLLHSQGLGDFAIYCQNNFHFHLPSWAQHYGDMARKCLCFNAGERVPPEFYIKYIGRVSPVNIKTFCRMPICFPYKMRTVYINQIICGINEYKDIEPRTLFLAVEILDRYLAKATPNLDSMEYITKAALYMAVKIDGYCELEVGDLGNDTAIIAAEKNILRTLDGYIMDNKSSTEISWDILLDYKKITGKTAGDILLLK